MSIDNLDSATRFEAAEFDRVRLEAMLCEFRTKAAVARRLPMFYPNSDGLPIRVPFDEGWVIRPYQIIENTVISGLAVSANNTLQLAYEFFPISNGLVAYNIDPIDLYEQDFKTIAQTLAEATEIVNNIAYMYWAMQVPYVKSIPDITSESDLPTQRQAPPVS